MTDIRITDIPIICEQDSQGNSTEHITDILMICEQDSQGNCTEHITDIPMICEQNSQEDSQGNSTEHAIRALGKYRAFITIIVVNIFSVYV